MNTTVLKSCLILSALASLPACRSLPPPAPCYQRPPVPAELLLPPESPSANRLLLDYLNSLQPQPAPVTETQPDSKPLFN